MTISILQFLKFNIFDERSTKYAHSQMLGVLSGIDYECFTKISEF